MNKKKKFLSEEETITRSICKESGKTLNLILRKIFENLDEAEFVKTCNNVSVELVKDVADFNAGASKLSEKTFHSHHVIYDFNGIKDVFRVHEHQIKSFEKKYNENLRQLPTNSLSTFFASVQYLINAKRLWRRYLKSRFGVIVKNWTSVKPLPQQLDKIICETALESYVFIQNQFFNWLYATHLILHNHPNISSLENLAIETLNLLGKALRDFRLSQLETTMNMKQAESISTEIEVANFVAWAEANLNFSINKRLAKTAEIEGKENINNDIAGAVIIALAEKEPEQPFSNGTGKTSVLSKIANQLENFNERATEINENDFPITSSTRDFALKEEARIDLKKILTGANLTVKEMNVYLQKEGQGLTFVEIAKALNVHEGTCKRQYYRAEKKLKDFMAKNKS